MSNEELYRELLRGIRECYRQAVEKDEPLIITGVMVKSGSIDLVCPVTNRAIDGKTLVSALVLFARVVKADFLVITTPGWEANSPGVKKIEELPLDDRHRVIFMEHGRLGEVPTAATATVTGNALGTWRVVKTNKSILPDGTTNPSKLNDDLQDFLEGMNN